ncbi:NlpC/P60 family protein [Rhodococcus spelaei]|uniref:NlpC/P60 family protein n=1 Tax=Rhodococcus spelaei TaxID=2546320 RepID=A0A541B1C1_9NOCA|nr:C40 family peptidase [Rhodococcus spelaei]TQF66120.1 NlpC/P60 family protein [Rhodococcus spelaei]
MIGIDLLARPLVELLETFGTGVMPSGGPAEALRVASVALDSAYAVGKFGIAELGAVWTGNAAQAASVKAEQAQAQHVALSDRGQDIAGVLTAASRDVNAGMAELEAIVQSFISVAVAAGPALATPAGQIAIVAAAIDHLSRGLAVVARVRAELTAHTAAMTELTAPEKSLDQADASVAQASVRPTGTGPTMSRTSSLQGGDAFSGFGRSFAQSASPVSSETYSGFSGGSSTFGHGSGSDPAPGSVHPRSGGSVDPRGSSAGVLVSLPDGSTAIAPNQEAADAVRNALSQQGVPYSWGGTSPGQGLDCSGLTQWAYGEAGVDLPRLADQQSVGCQVDQSDLMPGDLAVWDGHVAMVIGNGQMVEAGDPVSVSAVRTENIGMGFRGFYRPTA